MTKKTENKLSVSRVNNSYIKSNFIKPAEPFSLQKKMTEKTINQTFKHQVFYTEIFTDVHEQKKQFLTDERLSWYEAIESGNLKPSIDQDGNVRLLTDSLTNFKHAVWCEQLEIIANQWVERENYRSPQSQDQKNINLILQALAQLTRYLPELQEKKPNYFLDIDTYKIGVTFQGEGTLTLLIGGNSEVEYSYAQRQEKGSIRISGIAKLTTNIRNSKNIWKLLNLQGTIE